MYELGRIGSIFGFIGAPTLGPGWVLGRDLRPKLGYAEVWIQYHSGEAESRTRSPGIKRN